MGTELLPISNGQVSEEPWEQQAHRLDDALEHHRRDLREQLSQERDLVARIQAALDTCKEREKRVLRALAALEGTVVKAAPVKAKAEKKGTWVVSEKKVEQVYAALAELGQGRISEIAKPTGMAPETIRRAMTQLREQERVRIVKQSAADGPTFAPMPEVSDAA